MNSRPSLFRDLEEALDELRRHLRGEKTCIKVTRVTLTPAMQTVCELIEARRAAGLSTADVAAAAGLSLATVTRLEKGRVKNPTVDLMERYAKAIGMELRMSVVAAK